MLRILILAVFVGCVLGYLTGCAQYTEPCEGEPQYSYEVIKTPMSLETAREACETRGGKLASIHGDNIQEVYLTCMDDLAIQHPSSYYACWLDQPVIGIREKDNFTAYIHVSGIGGTLSTYWKMWAVCEYRVD